MKRVDLKETVSNLIEQSWQYEEESLLDYVIGTTDWLIYYDKDIRKFFADNDIDEKDIQLLIDNAFWWIDGKTMVIRHGYFSTSYEYSVAHTQEIEISLEGILKVTPWREKVIECNTDLSISNGYGYSATDMLCVCIDARKVKTWLEENRADYENN